MKHIKSFFSLFAGTFFSLTAISQATVCDSLSVSSVNIENEVMYLEVYNASTHFIAYPYFALVMDANDYINIQPPTSVPTFLSVPGDGNNGYTTAVYFASIDPADEVPLNTAFTGTLTITNPNDETFSCSLPVAFTYGSMTTSVADNEAISLSVFPNPANELLVVNATGLTGMLQYTITEVTGRQVISSTMSPMNGRMEIPTVQLAAGHYILSVVSEGKVLTAGFEKR
jgi:hypothetical protein